MTVSLSHFVFVYLTRCCWLKSTSSNEIYLLFFDKWCACHFVIAHQQDHSSHCTKNGLPFFFFFWIKSILSKWNQNIWRNSLLLFGDDSQHKKTYFFFGRNLFKVKKNKWQSPVQVTRTRLDGTMYRPSSFKSTNDIIELFLKENPFPTMFIFTFALWPFFYYQDYTWTKLIL